MKKIIPFSAILFVFVSCNKPQKIVSERFVDSLVVRYGEPSAIEKNESEIQFWKDRIQADLPGIVNELKYASALAGRFRLRGDINDVKKSDSILYATAWRFNSKEAAPYMALAAHAILQHQFKNADSLFQIAVRIGIKPYDLEATAFDINFESGNILFAEKNLKRIKKENDFGYQFRNAKMAHYNGDLDASIDAMKKAGEIVSSNDALQQIALSNLADLYIHAGKLKNAYEIYVQSIKENAADLHSIMGVGWIALVNDNRDTLAERLFQLVQSKTKLPDPLFKLAQVAQKRADRVMEKKYADAFATQAGDPVYGNMYNKYLIQLYTGILQKPGVAETIAKKELNNRVTPQTYAWYAWTLLCNNKLDDAYAIYQQYISGKPLEGLELYWMGKLMVQLKKGYNAQQFFKEAYKNRYDLMPAVVVDLEKELEE